MDDGAGKKGRPQDNNFTVSGTKVSNVDIGIRELMELCLAENDRRFAGYDERLARPTTMPGLIRLACRTLRGTRPHAIGMAR